MHGYLWNRDNHQGFNNTVSTWSECISLRADPGNKRREPIPVSGSTDDECIPKPPVVDDDNTCRLSRGKAFARFCFNADKDGLHM